MLIPVEVDTPDAGISLPVLMEKEPNNWPEHAQTVSPGMAIRGHIGYPLTAELGDRDVYCFAVEGEEPRVLRAELRGVPKLTMHLSIRTSQWTLIHATRAPSPGRGLVVPNLSLAPGRYCFVVGEASGGPPYRFNRKDPYELTFTLKPEAPGEEREPNDAFYNATPLEPGQEIRGLHGEAGDQDWYRVPLAGLPEKSLVTATFRGVPGVTASVTVFDHARREIATRRGIRGASVVLRDLKVQLHTGMIYVLVKGHDRFSVDARYRLKVEASSAMANREVEPNDTPQQAVRLSGMRGEVYGTIEVVSDKDWYVLPVPGQTNLRLEAIPPPGVDLVLTVRDMRGRRLAEANEGRVGEPELLANVRASVGVQILVSSSSQTFDPHGSYRLQWTATPADRGDEREPNNTPGQANLITPGITARGYVHPIKDVDWYRFRLMGFVGATARVRISVQGIPGVHLALSLMDDQQTELARSTQPTSEGVRVIETTLHYAKTYYVKVSDDQNQRASPSEHYELLVALVRR